MTEEEKAFRLEEELIPTKVAAAFAAARAQALASLSLGESLIESDWYFLYRVFSDGRKEVIKQVEPPRRVVPGRYLIR